MRCPVCRADNNPADVACRRCKADLSMLVTLEGRRRRLLATACAELRRGQSRQALSHARQAHDLRHGTDAARIIAVAHLLSGEFMEARKWHERASR